MGRLFLLLYVSFTVRNGGWWSRVEGKPANAIKRIRIRFLTSRDTPYNVANVRVRVLRLLSSMFSKVFSCESSTSPPIRSPTHKETRETERKICRLLSSLRAHLRSTAISLSLSCIHIYMLRSFLSTTFLLQAKSMLRSYRNKNLWFYFLVSTFIRDIANRY